MKARARTATGEERVRLWEKALEFWPPYADYQKKTEREIPVVVLDPVRLHAPAWPARAVSECPRQAGLFEDTIAVCRLTIPTGAESGAR